jgi:site-specific recombinase XerD
MEVEEYLRRSRLFQRLKSGDYGQFVERYAARLVEEGLARHGTWRSLNVVGGLLSWITRRHCKLAGLDEHIVERYLRHRAGRQSIQPGDRAALKVSFEEPAHSALIQRVLAIPNKRHDKRQVHFLTRPEIEAILAAPDRTMWLGRRDHTLLLVAAQTGLRLSELTGLDRNAVQLGSGAHIRCVGKGRKERCTPLTTLAQRALQAWLR